MSDQAFSDKAAALLARSETCLLGAVDACGYPVQWAMLRPEEHVDMNNIVFTTNTSSRHVAQYRDNDQASLYCYDPQLFQGLLLQGRMRISRDQTLLNRIWRDGYNLYYQLGPTDPDYCAMLFTSEKGRWYEDLHSTDFTP